MNTIITTTVWCNYTVSCALICFYDCGPSIIQHQMSVNAKMFIMSLDFSEIIINNVYYELRFSKIINRSIYYELRLQQNNHQ